MLSHLTPHDTGDLTVIALTAAGLGAILGFCVGLVAGTLRHDDTDADR